MLDNYNRIVKIPRNEEVIFQETDSNSTYGELTKQGVFQLIKNIPKKRYSSFCDLGSGIGIVIKYLLDSSNIFSKVVGIELSEERFLESKKLLKKYLKKSDVDIELINDNMLLCDISTYDIIYISNLCFNHNFNIILSKKIDKEAKNKSIIFANQDLILKRSHIKSHFGIDQSWGKNTCMYKYELIE